jgi:hypothetical protein
VNHIADKVIKMSHMKGSFAVFIGYRGVQSVITITDNRLVGYLIFNNRNRLVGYRLFYNRRLSVIQRNN